MKHILIDFENIQPNSFDIIDNPKECHMWLFLGVHQQKTLPYPLAKSLFRFPNTHVHLLEMQNAGKNALDHYLSFYIGKISEIDKQAEVYILARDSGYDVLVEHLNHTHEGLDIFRLNNIEALPNVWQGATIFHQEIRQDIHPKIDKPKNLKQKKSNKPKVSHELFDSAKKLLKSTPIIKRPKKVTSLQNWFKSKLKIEDVKITEKIVQKLINEKIVIADENGKLMYKKVLS